MTETHAQYASWVEEGGPSALVLKEYLEPVAGHGDVVFPPTFAPPEEKKKEPSNYIIDGIGDKSVCLLDSVGSQANRLEPIFKSERFRSLVPQIQIRVKTRTVNLLDVGHRAADALVRSTELALEFESAFKQYSHGDATGLAKIAPTSLVFGAWDSRGSQAKVARIIESTIRGYSVDKLQRAAQYFSSLANEEVEELMETNVEAQRKALSKAGFLDAPSGLTHGGVIVHGDIVRSTVVNLTALRAIGAEGEGPRALRHYILGLCLIAAFAPMDMFLRQGCLLVRGSKPMESRLVYRDGQKKDVTISAPEVESFAKGAASAFGVGQDRIVEFDSKAAKALLKKASKVKEDS